jgi:sigma-54 dependent transcriptional regulator, flagellar regulatory protein
MSLPMQVKLLRVLQERVFERVGSALQYRCNVRIIAATHRNLEDAIVKGAFREDLFYRLNVFPIEMPSLRARIEDLPTLIADFAALNVAAGRPRVTLSEPALDCLRAHAWPGNVRELGNLVERLSIVCGGRVVTSADLPPRYRPVGWTFDAANEASAAPELAALAAPVTAPAAVTQVRAASATAVAAADDAAEAALSEREALMMLEGPVAADGNILPPEGLDLRLHIATIEESLIRQALSRSDGIVAQAARLLGLRRTTLVEKLRKFDPGAGALLPED